MWSREPSSTGCAPQILALGDDVSELCGAKSVTYRVYDFFLEVIHGSGGFASS